MNIVRISDMFKLFIPLGSHTHKYTGPQCKMYFSLWAFVKKAWQKLLIFTCKRFTCDFAFIEIEFKEGETQHIVEIEVIFDGVREMREAFTVHLKPDENMIAETQVSNKMWI